MPACDLPYLFPNVVIRASAGTGKTFQLSNRYIALAHAGERPEHILAATFARKAAGEILERVLVRLARAANDPKELDLLASFVRKQFDERPLDRDACLTLLKKLVHHLHRLRVGTLDSFFVQIAGTFGLELGLPPGWRIVDENVDRQLRTQAIQEVLGGESASALVTLMHLLSKGEVSSRISDQIRQAADGLYDLFRETPREAWHMLRRPPRLDEAELDEAIRRIEDVPLPDKRNLRDAVISDLQQAREERWDDFLRNGVAKAIVEARPKYGQTPIPSELRDAYITLVYHAKAEIVCRTADQTEATWRLLEKFDVAYRRLKLEHRALRFDDVTRTLAEALSGERVDEVSFRLDAHVCQLLLDEFQDTSLAQWQVVQPFARTTSAEDARSFFCVGDVKQAIYGWRGGLSELFEAVDTQLPRVRTEPLDCSYRSSSIIIDAANFVFGKLKDNPVLGEFAEVTKAWAERFCEHTTARDEPGYACLQTAPLAEDPKQQRDATLVYAAAEAARLHREHPGCTVGILVRTNKSVGRLIYELRKTHQIVASEEGGNTLTDSPAVALVLSLLTLADHPGHTIARFHVARSPLGSLVGFEQWEDNAAARGLSLSLREALLRDGYGRTIYGWTRALAPYCDEREMNRLLQLVELAYGYDPQATSRAVDFVEFVKTQKVEDPTAAAVRVMTVHQAKGLQFDIVVLPELDVLLIGQAPRMVVGRPSPTESIDVVCRFLSKELRTVLPDSMQRLFELHQNQEVNESLCLLYVAMTRAVHALHMIVPPSVKGERSQTFARVLRGAFCPEGACDPETIVWEHGRRDWYAVGVQPSGCSDGLKPELQRADGLETCHLQTRPTEAIRLAPSPSQRGRGLERQSPSGLEGGSYVNLARRLQLENIEATNRGSLLHKWFEQIEWLDESIPNNEILRLAIRELPTDGIDTAAELAHFHKLLQRPTIRGALSRSGYRSLARMGFPAEIARELSDSDVTLEVRREHPFALREDNAILQGSIDRLVLFRRGNQVVAADILDYKSDAIIELAVPPRVEYYAPQVQAYRRAVARLFRLDVNRVTARLLFLEPAVIRLVAADPG